MILLKTFLIILIIMIISTCVGAKTIQPPPDKDLPASVQNYLRTLSDSVGVFEGVTTNPDGSRTGRKNEAVILYLGGNYYLEINVDGDDTWRGVLLTDLP